MVREKVTINLTTKKSDKIVKPAAKLKNITKGKKKPKERVHNQIKEILKAKQIREEEIKQMQHKADRAAKDYQKSKKELYWDDLSFRRFTRFQRITTSKNPQILITKSQKSQNLLIKKYQQGTKNLIINSVPCPKDVCDFEITFLKGSFQIGFVLNKDVSRVMLKNSITLRSEGSSLRIGGQWVKIKKGIEYGNRVRLRISQYQRFCKLMIQESTVWEGGLPAQWQYTDRVYFYIELAQISSLQLKVQQPKSPIK